MKYRYWIDDGLEIRTCLECKLSEFKSPEDGDWIIYVTHERAEYYFKCLLDGKDPNKCSNDDY